MTNTQLKRLKKLEERLPKNSKPWGIDFKALPTSALLELREILLTPDRSKAQVQRFHEILRKQP